MAEDAKPAQQGEQPDAAGQAGAAKPVEQGEKPKIIVDEDWKAQAQAEKARLAEEVESGKVAPSAPGAEQGRGPRQIPPASFSTLVSSLAAQTFLALGGYEDPRTGRRLVDLELAKHQIATLEVLEAKTRGNLTEDEKKVLDQALYETRMQYVQTAQSVSRV